MHYIKCNDITQVPEPTSDDVPRLIWVTTGELYADLEISGEPLRIKISDILVRNALPENPRFSAIYRSGNSFHYHTPDGWQTFATRNDLTDKNSDKTIQELFTEVFNDSTGVAALNQNVSDLLAILTAEDTGLAAVNRKITIIDENVTALESRVTAVESNDVTIDNRVKLIEDSLDGLLIRLGDI